jgi:type IV pilus assembly protein PilB
MSDINQKGVNMQNDYLDFDEAVAFLKTTPSTLYKWLQAGKVPGHKLGRQWRFLRDELEVHVSGKGSKINIQKDFLVLHELLLSRAKNKETKMEIENQSITEQLIWDAFDHGYRLIHLHPSQGKYEVSYRASEGLEKLSSLQEDSFFEIDKALNTLSSPIQEDALARRLYLHRGEEEVLQVRYQKIETVSGPRVTLRLWQPKVDDVPLEKITSSQETVKTFRDWTKKSHGLVIVSGATGSGKTTTIYSLLNELKKQGRVIFTIENSADVILDGYNQVEIKGRGRDNFVETFEQVYSSDADVICLGLNSYFGIEEQVFTAAYRAASTGHLVILQMDQPTAKDALNAFKKYVPDPTESVLVGVSSQRLVSDNNRRRAEYEFLKS